MVKYFHNLTGIAIIAMTENVNFQILFNIYFHNIPIYQKNNNWTDIK